jgi:hypothetical protein
MESTLPTLLSEWQWRREQLNRSLDDASLFAGEQIRVLDFLIRRYGDSPQALRPAPVRPIVDLRINHRAIVVLHHVWEGRIGGIKTAREAKARMSAVLDRMIAHASSVESDADDEGALFPDTQEADADINELVWSRITAKGLRRTGGDEPIAAALAENPFLPHWVARYLYQRIITPEKDDAPAAELLIQGQNRTAHHYAVCAWRELVGAGRMNEAWVALDQFLTRPEPSAEVAQGVRESLGHDNACVRLAALKILGRIGGLEDIGLLSDLLALPPASGEYAEERPAIIHTMQIISKKQ